MFERNGQKVGSILRDPKVEEGRPTRTAAKSKAPAKAEKQTTTQAETKSEPTKAAAKPAEEKSSGEDKPGN